MSRRIRRRDFVAILGSAALWAVAARAQTQMPVIGWLHSGSAESFGYTTAAFAEGLKETGFVEGRNLAIEYRWADGHYDRLAGLAADLVARRVSLILASGSTRPVEAAKAVTSTTPIVFAIGTDPLKA